MDGTADAWFDRELAGCTLAGERLSKRLRKLLVQIGSAMEQSIPLVCQDWVNTKAAYRFFSNERVSEADILAGHFQSTHDRVAAAEGPVLVLHDTTEFTYQREKPEAIGITKSINSGRDKAGRLRSHTVCGILMHSSLVATMEGLPLGLSAVKFWIRKKFKGTAALKKKVNRLAGDGGHTIADEMAEVAVKGLRRVEVRDSNGNLDEAVLEIRYRRVRVLPPVGKQKRYPALSLTVIHATERRIPRNRKKIDWKLITDLPVRLRKEAIEKLEWYALRWKIEVSHKILRSGCKAEESKLRTAQRLANLISVYCILSWRVFWITMLNRSAADAAPALALTEIEIGLLDYLVKDKNQEPPRSSTLSHYLIKIARLGGYLARANDPPPGNTVMWRGMSHLTDIALGAAIGTKIVGN